jgi:large subunit ribosomal protein L25
MADEIQLAVKPREIRGKQVRALRRSGWIPLALYGVKTPPQNLQAEERALRVVLNRAGHNRLIQLALGDGQPAHVVIAREIQREPISGKLLHVDFQEISLTEKMESTVPVLVSGTPPPVSRNEGLVIRGLESITVRVLPTDLIPDITVDISTLENIGDAIHVSDLHLGDKVEILTAPEEMLAKVIAVREEVIVEEVPAPTAEVEVVGKGKKEEEAGAEAETEAEAKE